MVLDMHIKDEISPTLRLIVNQFDENSRRPSDFQLYGQKSAEEFDGAIDCEVRTEIEDENFSTWPCDHDSHTSLGSNDADPKFSSYPQVLYCYRHSPKTSMPVLKNVLKDIFFIKCLVDL